MRGGLSRGAADRGRAVVKMEFSDWIDLSAAAFSAEVAGGTAFLALATFRLAKFTKIAVVNTEDGLRQADKHHQEMFLVTSSGLSTQFI